MPLKVPIQRTLRPPSTGIRALDRMTDRAWPKGHQLRVIAAFLKARDLLPELDRYLDQEFEVEEAGDLMFWTYRLRNTLASGRPTFRNSRFDWMRKTADELRKDCLHSGWELIYQALGGTNMQELVRDERHRGFVAGELSRALGELEQHTTLPFRKEQRERLEAEAREAGCQD